MITYSKSYQEFIGIVTSKNLIIHKVSDRNSAYYLVAKDGMLFYETYLAKDNGPDHLDFENNYAQRAVNAFPDNSMPVTISSSLFTKPYTNLQVVAKDRKSTRLNSSHTDISRMPSSA